MRGDVAVALVPRACLVAMAAKCGKITERHRLLFLHDVLTFAACDPGWVAAALAFEGRVSAEPEAAGARLHDWALGPGQPEATAQRVEETLAALEGEATDHFGWRDRADING